MGDLGSGEQNMLIIWQFLSADWPHSVLCACVCVCKSMYVLYACDCALVCVRAANMVSSHRVANELNKSLCGRV